ncbi:MAG: tripartite tricarboxylate transporter TctB family protein [Chloroflexi bacterium]|nr:tripartite tricarboxylate transporter TctB family protein [Chloroflexota bacterium]
MKLTGISYVYIVILAVMVLVISLSLEMEHFSSKLLPLVLGGFILALTAVAFWRELKAKVRPRIGAVEDETDGGGRQQSRNHLSAAAWMLGFFVAIHLVGFILAITLFVLSYTKANGRNWLTAIVLTIFTTGIIYFLFERVLGVDLYRGLLLAALGF